MHTILGANGQIAREVSKELFKNYTQKIRQVSRNPEKVNTSDEIFSANLLNPQQTNDAVKGSEIVYLTVGLPLNTKIWQEQFPIIMHNVVAACERQKAKLAFFDNTYMYPQNAHPLTEETPFQPVGEKGKVRAEIAEFLLKAMLEKKIEAVICRAPEFYGKDKTQSFINTFLFNHIKENKKPQVMLNEKTLRTLIWTPDAAKAMILIASQSENYNQTWHLPCDDNRLSFEEMIKLSEKIKKRKIEYEILSRETIENNYSELSELLPRYEYDNIFVSDKFKQKFPEFEITSYETGIRLMIEE